jgi:hypothetical protein
MLKRNLKHNPGANQRNKIPKPLNAKTTKSDKNVKKIYNHR